MNYDKRIIKRPLDCYDTEEAKKFIGKKGYFANNVSAFQDLKTLPDDVYLRYASLKKVDSEQVIAFSDDIDSLGWCHFLPEEWVKPEKRYRPFTKEEFLKLFDLGKFHSIRRIGNPYDRLVITNVCSSEEDLWLYANLNSHDGYGTLWFLNECEYFDGKEWRRFGVEE